MTFCRLIDPCLVQPPSEKLLPEADGNKYRDPQPDDVQKVRETSNHSLPKIGCRHQNLPSELRELYRSRGRKAVRAVADGGCKESRLSRHKMTGTYMSTQRKIWHTQSLHGPALENPLELKEVDTVDTCFHLYPRNYLQLIPTCE